VYVSGISEDVEMTYPYQ